MKVLEKARVFVIPVTTTRVYNLQARLATLKVPLQSLGWFIALPQTLGLADSVRQGQTLKFMTTKII
jgi:hypothetical protein